MNPTAAMLIAEIRAERDAARDEAEQQRTRAEAAEAALADSYDLVAHIERQREFSLRTFGPGHAGDRVRGLRDHIEGELDEVECAPFDTEEWIDIVILALEGAWRTGSTSREIALTLREKQAKNEARKWPDWRTATPGKAIEHIREGGA